MMSTANVYAVCYTEGDGTANAVWRDAGIRLTISKITTLTYGTESTSFPIRTMTSTNTAAATNTLPQVANKAIVTYAGGLAADKWLSMVDSTLNNGNPCVRWTV